MTPRTKRALGALLTTLCASLIGYSVGADSAATATIVAAPPAESVRVVYSLDTKQTDQELIALIDAAKSHVYFAVYTFTLTDIAEALARAKARGVDVRGLVDSKQGAEQFSAPVLEILARAQIPVLVEEHAGGSGIMHLKMLVTDSAYAHGSYNWTKSATTVNDEILEIGTDPAMRKVYEDLLKRLFDKYQGNLLKTETAVSVGTVDYTDAPSHIGETASVRGRVVEVYTSASGTTFLNFCADYKTCPFSAVIFSSDAKKFGDLEQYKGQTVTVTGKIVSYQGRTEIVLNSPGQLTK